MGWLNAEKPPDKVTGAYFRQFVERLRTALNFIDSSNFGDGLEGSILTDRSVYLQTKITGYGGLTFQEDFFALAQGLSFNATALTSLGSSTLWSPSWNNYAKLYLEVTGYVANATYPATVEVHGTSGAIASHQITAVTMTRHEWEITPTPTEGTTLVFKSLVGNATYPLTILSARLILKLTENV